MTHSNETGTGPQSVRVRTPPAALQRWVNEGGSAPDDTSARERPFWESRREPRDTVSGCRELAAQDHLRAVATDTENGRRVYERSAASWETRADEIQKMDDASAEQRATDRALWASEETEDSA